MEPDRHECLILLRACWAAKCVAESASAVGSQPEGHATLACLLASKCVAVAVALAQRGGERRGKGEE